MNKLVLFFAIVISFSAHALTGTVTTEYWNCTQPSWISDIKYIKFEPLENDVKNVFLNTCELDEDCEGRRYYEWQTFRKITGSTNPDSVSYINETYNFTVNSTDRTILTITVLKSPDTVCTIKL